MRNSGISYSAVPPGHSLYMTPMDDFLPHEVIQKHLTDWHKRSFRGAIADTFSIIIGNHYDLNLSAHGSKGLLDILIFPLISRLLIGMYGEFLVRLSDERGSGYNNTKMGVYIFLVLPVATLLELLRCCLSALLTIALLPLIGLVYIIITLRRKYHLHQCRENIKKTWVKDGKDNSRTTIGALFGNSLRHPTKLQRTTKRSKKNKLALTACLGRNLPEPLLPIDLFVQIGKYMGDGDIERLTKLIPDKRQQQRITFLSYQYSYKDREGASVSFTLEDPVNENYKNLNRFIASWNTLSTIDEPPKPPDPGDKSLERKHR